MEFEELQIRNQLSEDYLQIAEERSFIFENIDSFVALSRENTTVTELGLYPFDSAPGSYWDKVGQMVGNLMELKTITIDFLPSTDDDDDDDDDDDGDEARIPTWETHLVESCRMFSVRLSFARIQMITMQRLKKSKA
jgi:hypothetical protein